MTIKVILLNPLQLLIKAVPFQYSSLSLISYHSSYPLEYISSILIKESDRSINIIRLRE
jgi:hypothetical protein